MLFNKRNKQIKNFVEIVLKETEDLAKDCETVALKRYIKNIEKDIVNVILLDRSSSKAIFEKFKYILWGNLPRLTREYLLQRFNLNLNETGFGVPTPSSRVVRCDEPVGVSLEKYVQINENSSKIRGALSRFSEDELIDIFTEVTHELNERKKDKNKDNAGTGI